MKKSEENHTEDEGVYPSYEEIMQQRAGTEEYYDWDGVPIRIVWDKEGKISRRYGLRQGEWAEGWPSDGVFFNEAMKITKNNFDKLLLNPRKLGE